MKNWINKNYKTLIIAAFLIPILTVAIVSISHVTEWYGISNPVTWAVYLSIGIEIAALSALAAISANMGSKVYFPFAIVTIVQFIGNIFFAYSFINIDSKQFKDWVDLVAPLVEFMGVDSTDYVGHKRFLALFSGGMLPLISLSFLHMLVKFTEEDRLNQKPVDKEPVKINSSEIVSEVSRLRLSEDDLQILEKALLDPQEPNEALVEAAIKYENTKKERQRELLAEMMKNDQELGLYDEPYDNPLIKEPVVSDDFTIGLDGAFEMTSEPISTETPKTAPEMVITTNDDIISTIPADDEISDWDLTDIPEETPEPKNNFQTMMDEIAERKIREQLLSEMTPKDEEPVSDNIEPKDVDAIIDPIDEEIESTEIIEDTYNIAQLIQKDDVTPALSDEEVRSMLMDEWERKFDLGEMGENTFQEEPTNDEEEENFSTIEANDTNFFQEEVNTESFEPEVQKFNIDDAYAPKEDVDFANEQQNSFWRDHLNDIEEDLKKK
jgi:hypothetical protein